MGDPLVLVWIACAAAWGFMAGHYRPVEMYRTYKALRAYKA